MMRPESPGVRLRIVYDGTPPNVWDGGAKDFGLQDKANVLHLGKTGRDGRIVFEVSLAVKPENTGNPVFLGGFAHGPPKERFLYLSWRNANGAYAQRLKLPLGGISRTDIEEAKGKPLLGEVAPSSKPRVPGGTNVGGTRVVLWRPADR
jgi:Family of unknown function (DUF5990)